MTTELKTMQDLSNLLAEMPPLEAWAALQEWLTSLEKFAFVGKLMSIYTPNMLLNLKAVEAHSFTTPPATHIQEVTKDAPKFSQKEVVECLSLMSQVVDKLLTLSDKRRQVRVVSAVLQATADMLSECHQDEESMMVGYVLDDIYSELKHLKGVTF